MDWWLALIIILGGLLVIITTGLPVAMCFVFMNVIGAFIWWGGEAGLSQFILSLWRSVGTFTMLPVPLFIFMGEVMFQSGIATHVIDAVDKWLGRLPGRLGVLAVAAGTLFSVMSGVTLGSTAMLGDTLTPEMERRGYKKPMSLGPILGSGGLAMMIPPSNIAVILAGLAEISVAKMLIGGIVPGLLMAIFYASYIVIRCKLQPSLAPPYETVPTPLSEKLIGIIRYVLPLGFIVFLVIGLIFVGVATPSEGAAMGAVGSIILAAFYGGLNWKMIKKSLWGTIRITGMMFLIISGAQAFSQILSFSGATRGLVEFMVSLPVATIFLPTIMIIVLLFLGMFIGAMTILVITVPIFYPIVHAMGFNPLWFGLLMLLGSEMSHTTPPYGGLLFVMKGVAPPGTTMGDCVRAALPFLGCDAIVMILMLVFPSVALWLPSLM